MRREDGAPPRILVVDDEYLVALDTAAMLRALGCDVVGPASRLGEALALARQEHLDGAVLDINLAGARSFPVAEVLGERGVPTVFVTGYASADAGVPAHLRHIPVLSKPLHDGALAEALATFARKE